MEEEAEKLELHVSWVKRRSRITAIVLH